METYYRGYKHDLFTAIYLITFYLNSLPNFNKSNYKVYFNNLLGIPAILTMISYRIYTEKRADNFAITNSSNEELQGGVRFFRAVLEENRNNRTTLWKRLTITPSGENLLDIIHPFFATRIQKISNKLARRNVTYIHKSPEESSRIQALVVAFNS